VSTGRDDDALSWDGDDDPTLEVGAPSAAPVLPRGYTAVGPGSERVRGVDDPAERAGRGGRGDKPAPSGDAPESGAAPIEQGDAPGAEPAPAASAPHRPLGNVELVALGLLAGVYLLFTIGWIVGGLRLQPVAVFLVDPSAVVPALWLAFSAPALWFLTTYALTRRSPAWLRFAWLVGGAILLVPWPFVMIGAVGL
jgi:hypothetical protein